MRRQELEWLWAVRFRLNLQVPERLLLSVFVRESIINILFQMAMSCPCWLSFCGADGKRRIGNVVQGYVLALFCFCFVRVYFSLYLSRFDAFRSMDTTFGILNIELHITTLRTTSGSYTLLTVSTVLPYKYLMSSNQANSIFKYIVNVVPLSIISAALRFASCSLPDLESRIATEQSYSF